jgi:hypothetical protein
MKKAVIAVLMVLACFGGYFVWTLQQQLDTERAKVRELSAQIDTMREEAAGSAKAPVDSAELRRLREEQAELARLRNEVTQLRRQVKDAAAATAKVEAAQKVESTTPVQEPRPDYTTFESSSHTVMAWNQTFITGGWQTKPGRRALLLSKVESPTKQKGGQVLISSKILEMPESSFPQGMNTLLSPEQAQYMLSEWEKNEEVKVLSSPRIVTHDGQAAAVQVGQQVPTPTGEQVFRGISVELTPVISPDGATVDLSLHPKIDLPAKEGN